MKRRWWPHALALLSYTLMTLVVCFPLPWRMGEQVIANRPGQVDAYLGIWNVWWTAEALSRGINPYVTPLLFHPQGLDLFWQTLSLPQGLLALPITLTAGPLPAYNMLILLSFILGGYFTFLFIRAALTELEPTYVTELAAIIGGAVYAFAPFHMQKVLDAQLEVASVQWLPLWALGMLALMRRPNWPRALMAGGLLLWVGLGTWYYGLFALIATGLLIGLWAVRWGNEAPATGGVRVPGLGVVIVPQALLWGTVPIGVWFAVMLPRLLSLAQTGDNLLGDARSEMVSYADLVSFWLPNPHHPVWGAAVSAFATSIQPSVPLWNVAMGWIGIGLALGGVALGWREHWRWLVLGVVAAAFALGSNITLLGWQSGIPGPFALIRDLPGVRSSHRPNHFVLISILTTALFAALGARAVLLRASKAPQRGLITLGLLGAIVAIDGWVGPQPMFQRAMPAPYLSMPEPDGGAILPIPVHLNVSNSEHLWYQTEHRWPIIGGFIGREPPYPLGRYAPGISELRFGTVERDDVLSPGWPELARETLAAYTIRQVIFHHETMAETLEPVAAIIDEMGLERTYRDDLVSIYPVPEPPNVRPLAYLGTGWGPLERDAALRWRWMGDQAEVYLLNPHAEQQVVQLTLDLEAFEQARPLEFRLNGTPLFSIEVSRARMVRSVRLLLPPGENLLELTAPSAAPEGQPSRRLSIALMGLRIE